MKQIFPILLLFFFAGCGEELIQYNVNTGTPIVESYLEEGSNEITVKLYSMEVYSEDEYLLSKAIPGLNLQVNDMNLTEEKTSEGKGTGTYSLNLGSKTIQGLETYHLQFDYKGKNVTASTVIPKPVTGLKIDPASITRSSYYWYTDSTEVVLSWDDPDHSYYQVYVDSPTSSGSGFPGGNMTFGKRIMQPFQSNTYNLNPHDLMWTGAYNIYLYRVNKEYVELYERISSSDLANPVSFIDNAFGIFTAMSSASVKFYVYESN